jgi:hypothetical protein
VSTGTTEPSVSEVFSAVAQRVRALHPGDEERMLRSPGLRTAGKLNWMRQEADFFTRDGTRNRADLVVEGAPVVAHDPDSEVVVAAD